MKKFNIVPIKITYIITGMFPYFFKYLPENTVKHDADKTPIIIAMTANALNEDKQRCFDSGMDYFIAKPITLESLYRVIKNWV